MNKYDFENRVAIITGGAQGIGRAVGERMLSSGGKVSIGDRDVDLLKKTIADLDQQARIQGLEADIGDLAAVELAVAATLKRFGKIDILINNAAIVGPNLPTWEYPPEAFRDVVNIGLLGTFHCCRAIVPGMIEANYGRIVNLSSIAGKEGNAGMIAYSASKAAVIGMTKVQGKEVAGTGVTVNALAPAVIQTPMVHALPEQQVKYMTDKIPMGRCGTLDELVAMVEFIVSPSCSYTTGFTFDLSGGRATY